MLTTALPRPRGMLVVIVVNVVFGLLSIGAAVVSLSTGHPIPEPTGLGFLQPLAPVFPTVEIFLGTFFFVISYGLWLGRRWGWIANIVYELIHIIADVGFIASRSFAIDKFIGLVIILGLLYYLTRPNVRTYFGKGGLPAAAH